jgi:hypothetical protein
VREVLDARLDAYDPWFYAYCGGLADLKTLPPTFGTRRTCSTSPVSTRVVRVFSTQAQASD